MALNTRVVLIFKSVNESLVTIQMKATERCFKMLSKESNCDEIMPSVYKL